MTDTVSAVDAELRDYVAERLHQWGEWNRIGGRSGRYKCTLASARDGSPPQEQVAYIPPHVEEVERAILKINQQHPRLVKLIKKRFIRGLTYEEMAGDWHTNPGAIYRHLQRAYDLLAPHLTPEMELVV